ncbi:histone-like nucleoid-structuring protein Lsr2 [Brevibacterium sediminis]
MIETITDDIDDTPITSEDEGRTVQFTIDGVAYSIDLTIAHTNELEQSLRPFIAVARKQPRISRSKSRGTRPRRDKEQLDAIRRWARETGHEVSDRGRIPMYIEEAYENSR